MSRPLHDAVWINGSVGAGKTTTAERVAEELEKRGIPGAVIDVDWLRRAWPSAPDDPFQFELAVANLEAVAGNFRGRGAQVIVAAGVVETTEQFERCATAVGSGHPLLVRLVVEPEVASARLRARHSDNEAELSWHESRHPELAGILDRAGFMDELVLDNTRLATTEAAARIVDVLRN